VFLQQLALFLDVLLERALLRQLHDQRKLLLAQLEMEEGEHFGVGELFESGHKLEVVVLEMLEVRLRPELVDDFDGIFLLILLVDAAIDSRVVTHADQFLPLIQVDTQGGDICNALL